MQKSFVANIVKIVEQLLGDKSGGCVLRMHPIPDMGYAG